jgi:glycosyltransferase involved in cell wall biosynthesis
MTPDTLHVAGEMSNLAIWGVMCVRNEADRYLADVLDWHLNFLDGIFVFDDQSTDHTVEICRQYPKVEVEVRPDDVPALLEHEGDFRQAGWEAFETSVQPMDWDWVLAIDADEFFVAPGDERTALLDIIRYAEFDKSCAAKLRIEEIYSVDGGVPHERVDGYWGGINGLRLVRYDPVARFANRRLGGGSVPVPRRSIMDATDWSGRLQHFGYVRSEDRGTKYDRYRSVPGHNERHVQSIIEPPTLRPSKVRKGLLL